MTGWIILATYIVGALVMSASVAYFDRKAKVPAFAVVCGLCWPVVLAVAPLAGVAWFIQRDSKGPTQ